MGAPIPTLRETGSNKQYFNSIIESCVGLQALIVLSYNSQLWACGDCPPLETSILLRPKLIPVRYRKAVLFASTGTVVEIGLATPENPGEIIG